MPLLLFLLIPVIAIVAVIMAIGSALLPRGVAQFLAHILSLSVAAAVAFFCTTLFYILAAIPDTLVVGTKYAGHFAVPGYVHVLVFIGFFLACLIFTGGISRFTHSVLRHRQAEPSTTVVYPTEQRIVILKEKPEGGYTYLGEKSRFHPGEPFA
jgi:hypothetical protein